jgi:hypothetical protein
MKFRNFLVGTLLALTSAVAWAGATDLQFSPTTSAGHDFNHAPIGQTFKALASQVKAGIFIADEDSFTNWLQQTYPDLSPYPYAIAPSVTVKVQLLHGEGVSGTVLDSRNLTLNKPFMGFVDVDYAAAGVSLVPGNMYTLLMTDVSGQSYQNGVTGWVVPAVHDYNTGANQPPGAYADGLPILQGALVTDDTGIGDNAFEVLDVGGSTPPPLAISGTLPYGQVGQLYTATLSASGGVPPYNWSSSSLPAGLTLNSKGTISGTPTTAGTYSVGVTVTDGGSATASSNYSMVISPELSCTKPKTAKSSKGKGTVTTVGGGYITVGTKRIDYASCTSMNYGGYSKVPTVGDKVEWQGYVESNGNVMAQILTLN